MSVRPGWWVIVPVKGTGLAKSRLGVEWHGDVRALATAFALDVIEALLQATSVAGVVVVTTATEREILARGLPDGAVEFVADPDIGLNPAIEAGVLHARRGGQVPVAALLGDLPALTAADVDQALLWADEAPASFLPDAEGTGTTMVTAGRGIRYRGAFGEGSAGRHRDAGLHEVDLDLPRIRHDVDTLADLGALPSVGRHTAALLGAEV